MPFILKFVCALSIFGILFPAGSIIPVGSYKIDGEVVSYSEWWRSGAGIATIIIGIPLFLTGIGILKKRKWSRYAFPFILACSYLVIPYDQIEVNIVVIVSNSLLSVLLLGYFIKSKAVERYYVQTRNAT